MGTRTIVGREAAAWIRKLGLEKHPEGGYFGQTYRSKTEASIAGFDGPRSIATAIYYLLPAGEGQFSSFHRLKSDELWHFYSGSALVIYSIGKDGRLNRTRLGSKGRAALPQAVVRAGTWFAAAVDSPVNSARSKRTRGRSGYAGGSSYSLVGCTMSPGFDYRDWELGKRDDLVRVFPQHRQVIERYTRQ